MNSKLLLDMGERAGWTGAEAAVSLVAVEVADLPVWWAAPAALVLAAAKGAIAGRLGRKGTASTLPAGADPASLPRVG